MYEKYTRKNPNGSYRVPVNTDIEFRLVADKMHQAFFGKFIDALGAYEESGLSPEQVEKLGKIGKDKLQIALNRAGIGISL